MKRKYFTIIILSLLLLTNCKKNNVLLDNAKEVDDDIKLNRNLREIFTDITQESDYLYFKDYDAFNLTIKYLQGLNDQEKNNWEEKFNNFQSMKNKFIENLALDTMHFWKTQYIDSIPENSIVKHAKEICDSKFMYVKCFFNRKKNIYEEFKNDDDGFEEYFLVKNICIESYSDLVNPRGIVRIGDSLYQFTRDLIKSIDANAKDKVRKLINTTIDFSNKNDGVVVRKYSNLHDFEKLNSCTPPSYYYNSEWNTSSSIEFSSNPKYKLVLNGEFNLINNHYCPAQYTPVVLVNAHSYKKSIYNIRWIEHLSLKTIEVSFTVNHPDGSVYNVYSNQAYNNWWTATYTKNFPEINSHHYTNMFRVTNFHARATMAGGSNGGVTTISH